MSLSLSDLLARGGLDTGLAALCVLIALAANGVIKLAISFYAGGSSFGRSVAVGFAAMFAAGAACWLLST
ncbi:MAG: hypothetical protein EHM65_07165 [Acidobacteriales bacterium]|nr:MAG: hypothetical protein EHM65_07165 [Terriglobales bacterium]